MNRTLIFQRVAHLPRRIVLECLVVFELVRLVLYNRVGSALVTQPGSPVVSLTTWGKRSKTVYLAIESIATGRLRPSRLILWIDDENLFRNLPSAVLRLQQRGLEIKLCKNYGPHTKYYPYVESEREFKVPLVTADDDRFYPRDWLMNLRNAFIAHPEAINCYWASAIVPDTNILMPCSEWCPRVKTRASSYSYIAHGVGGVCYPPPFLEYLRSAGTAFEMCCPKQDDIWLHVQAVRAGYRVRQIFPELPYFSVRNVPGTWQSGLTRENSLYGGGDDLAVRKTYASSDIRMILNDYFGSVLNAGSQSTKKTQ